MLEPRLIFEDSDDLVSWVMDIVRFYRKKRFSLFDFLIYSSKETVIKILKNLINDGNFTISYIDFDSFDYKDAYLLSITRDNEIYIEKALSNGKYILVSEPACLIEDTCDPKIIDAIDIDLPLVYHINNK